MKVLVTGASGYIGGQTAIQLKDQGHEVYGLDWARLPDHLHSLNLFRDFCQFDFASHESLAWIAQQQFDAIIHCAGTSLVGPSIKNPADYYENNFVKTKKLCDFLMTFEHQPRLIFSSSAAVYGEPIMTPCQEIDPTEPINPYGQSKLMIEWLMWSYHMAYNFDYVAFRYFNACGADVDARHGQAPGATHIIARALETARDNSTFTCYGNDYDTPDRTCVRDYVHVSDIANAHILALNTKSVTAGVYNLGSATGASNLEIIRTAEEVAEKTIPVNFASRREGDPAILTADPSRFANATGWRPKYNLKEMIAHAWAWYNV
jgi:UDP-glucose 4-epimerase